MINSKSYSMYIDDLNSFSPLNKEKEKEIFIAYREKGSRKAYNTIFSSNAKFVVKIAHKYKNQGVPLEDLIGAGNVGMAKAIESFDYNRNMKFISWAVWNIRQAILNELATNSRFLRITGTEANNKHILDKKVAKLEQKLGRKATVKEIATELKYSIKKVMHMEALNPHVSIDTESLQGFLSSNTGTPYDNQESSDATQKIISLLHKVNLTDRELTVLYMYFGISYATSHTLEEIGEVFGVTREAIRMIKKHAIEKIDRYNNRMIAQNKPHLELEMVL